MCGSARAKRKFVSDEAIADAARPLRTAVLQPPSTHPLDPPRVLQAIGSASDGSRADRPHDRDPAPAKGASPSSCAFKDLVAPDAGRRCSAETCLHGGAAVAEEGVNRAVCDVERRRLRLHGARPSFPAEPRCGPVPAGRGAPRPAHSPPERPAESLLTKRHEEEKKKKKKQQQQQQRGRFADKLVPRKAPASSLFGNHDGD
ncbi:hypothetical protein GN956_G20345 [Arapaima gigas]